MDNEEDRVSMPLVNTIEMLHKAQSGQYAVCALNAENLEMLQAIIAAAENCQAPIIVQTTPATIVYAGNGYTPIKHRLGEIPGYRFQGLRYFFYMAYAAADAAAIPVALHLDHGDSFVLTDEAIKAGYTSVMIDGSHMSFYDNVGITRQVADAAHRAGRSVEGEIGVVGGKEDDLICSIADSYTDPVQAARFASMTGVDSLAVGIGTSHGFYASKPNVDIYRLARIRDTVPIPLVLHGGTGIPEDTIRSCIENGICKVNYATELRAAYTAAVRQKLGEDASIVDVKVYSEAGRLAVLELSEQKIKLCGSENKA